MKAKILTLPVVIAVVAVLALTVTAGLIATAYFSSGQPEPQANALAIDTPSEGGTSASKVDAGNPATTSGQEQDEPSSSRVTETAVAIHTGASTSNDAGPSAETEVAARPATPPQPTAGIEEPQEANNPEHTAPSPVPASSTSPTPVPGSITLLQQPADNQGLPSTRTPASLLPDPIPSSNPPEAGDGAPNVNSTGDALNPDDASEGGGDRSPNIPDKVPPKYPNLSSHLNQLVVSVEAGQTTAEKAAQSISIYNDESVAVTVYLSGYVDDVVTFLEENGGDPRNVGEDYIEAYVPVPLLGPVSERPGVLKVREIIPPQASKTGAAYRP